MQYNQWLVITVMTVLMSSMPPDCERAAKAPTLQSTMRQMQFYHDQHPRHLEWGVPVLVALENCAMYCH
jgi:hypothetical protein